MVLHTSEIFDSCCHLGPVDQLCGSFGCVSFEAFFWSWETTSSQPVWGARWLPQRKSTRTTKHLSHTQNPGNWCQTTLIPGFDCDSCFLGPFLQTVSRRFVSLRGAPKRPGARGRRWQWGPLVGLFGRDTKRTPHIFLLGPPRNLRGKS